MRYDIECLVVGLSVACLPFWTNFGGIVDQVLTRGLIAFGVALGVAAYRVHHYGREG